jgi:hypothetical protein
MVCGELDVATAQNEQNQRDDREDDQNCPKHLTPFRPLDCDCLWNITPRGKIWEAGDA